MTNKKIILSLTDSQQIELLPVPEDSLVSKELGLHLRLQSVLYQQAKHYLNHDMIKVHRKRVREREREKERERQRERERERDREREKERKRKRERDRE